MSSGPESNPRGRAALRAAVGLGVSALLLAWILWRIDLRETARIMGGVELAWLIWVPLINVTVLSLKGLRWSVILSETLGRRPAHCYRAVYIGFLGNAVLPAKAGEIVRIQVCRRHNEAPFMRVLATVVLERVMDAFVLAGCLVATTLVFPLPSWVARGAVLTAGLSLFALLILLVLSGRRVEPPGWLFPGQVGRWLRVRFMGLATTFATGLSAVRSNRALARALVVTAATWAVEATAAWLGMRAYGAVSVLGPQSYLMALLTVSIAAAGVAVPSAPSGVGTHQFLYIVCLGWFGVSPEVATAISVSLVLLALVSVAAVGIPSLLGEGVGLHLLRVANTGHTEIPKDHTTG